jgi:hypothetical protein
MPPQTVYVNNMTDVGGYTVDVSHEDGISTAVDVATLPSPVSLDGVTSYTQIAVECQTCHTVTGYPMAGGPKSQYLHYLKMMTLPAEEVAAVAIVRGLTDFGGLTDTGTQTALATEIIVDECTIQGVPFLNLQGF